LTATPRALAAGLEIRPVTRAEVAAWRELRAEALKNHPTAFSSAYEDFILQEEAEVASRIPEPGGSDVLFGVYVAGELCGCAGFFREKGLKERHRGLMWGVYLRPLLRGQGAGEALVERIIDHARQHVDVLRSAVTSDNVGVRDLYLRMGFEHFAVEPRALRHDGRDHDEDLLIMTFD
jgi:RimJ/RimL family protein N-acetyltransferase